MTGFRVGVLVLATFAVTAPSLRAQSAAYDADSNPFFSIPWEPGPTIGTVGSESKVEVAEHCLFTDEAGARRFLELTENPPTGIEKAVLYCEGELGDAWFVLFSFDPSGYVRDDEGRNLDADAILESVRRGTSNSNKQRRSLGWDTLAIDGWVRRPYYDASTNNLTWAIQARAQDDEPTINHSVRLLGRNGVMHVDLVTGPGEMDMALPTFDAMVASHQFLPGRRYWEWTEGDRVASYGLTALVAGGAGAVAMKTGFLAKFWKLLLIPFLAFGTWVKSLFGRPRDPAM